MGQIPRLMTGKGKDRGKVFAVTQYEAIDDEKFTAITKFDVTDQLDQVLHMVYDTLALDLKKNAMKHRPLVVCLCGSTKFREEYRSTFAKLTIEGHIVLTVGCLKGDPEWGTAPKEQLDELHKRKIDLADAIFVIDVDNYIGESTASEIAYAKEVGRAIYYMNQTHLNWMPDA